MLVTIVAALALSHAPLNPGFVQRKKKEPVNEEPAIRAAVKQVEKAFETKNFKMFSAMCLPNFQTEDPNGKVMNYKQSMAQMKKDMAPLYDIKANITVGWIKIDGNKATLDDRYLVKAKYKDKTGTHSMRMEGSETVSLKKVRGKWMSYYVKGHDDSLAIDGKLVMHRP